MKPNEVDVLLFAAAREAAGTGALRMAVPERGVDVTAFLGLLFHVAPALTPYARALRIAVNGCYADGHDRVSPGDEVAVIPPVAGG
jgi:molybdopterin converting factor subunit 1